MREFFSTKYLSRNWIPVSILLASLTLTVVATIYVEHQITNREQLRFSYSVLTTRDGIRDRIGAYISMLKATSGLLKIEQDLTRKDFKQFVDRIEVDSQYPGIQGVGYVTLVTSTELPAFIAKMEQEGIDTFRVWPGYPRAVYAPITLIEPLDRRNQASIGFDMFTEAALRPTMEKARDYGRTVATGRVTLVQEVDSFKQAGFIIFHPVYLGEGMPSTIADRRKAIRGFVYAPFRAGDLFRGILGDQKTARVDFEVYDGLAAQSNLLYSSDGHSDLTGKQRYHGTLPINIAGRLWTIAFRSRKGLEVSSNRGILPYLLIIGSLFSIGLFMLSRWQQRARLTAELSTGSLISSQQALRSSEARLRRLVESNMIGVVFVDRQWKVVDANNAFLDLIGFSREQMNTEGIDWETQVPREFSDISEEAKRELEQFGRCSPFELEFEREDHCRVPALVGFAHLENDAAHTVAFVVDLTQRKRDEQLIEGQSIILEHVAKGIRFEKIMEEIVLLAQEQSGSDTCGAIFFTDPTHSFLKVGAGPNIPKDYLQQIDGQEISRMIGSEAAAVVRAEPVWVSDTSLDPLWKPLAEIAQRHSLKAAWAIPIFSGDGEILGTFSLYFPTIRTPDHRDMKLVNSVTRLAAIAMERVRFMDTLLRSKELAEDANAAKDQFLAVLSHELRTPLTPVLSIVELLKTDDATTPETRRWLEVIDRNILLEARLIDDLLDVTRITKGKIELSLAKVDIHDLIRHVAQMSDAEIAEKQIEFSCKFEAKQYHVLADAARIQQVFWNLIKNAVKFTSNGGKVEVRTVNEPGSILVQVSDTGIGMEPAVLSRIFNAFEQGEKTVTRRFGGLGLGLAISKMLVDLHRGEIVARSEGEGMGSAFEVRLALDE